jgi:hypothetical protein
MCLVLPFASCVAVLVRVVGREVGRIAQIAGWQQHSGAGNSVEALEAVRMSLEVWWYS